MAYNVGDKVRVRLWNDMAHEYGFDDDGDIVMSGCEYFVSDMKHFCGEIVTIEVSRPYGYRIAEDGGHWTWTDEMFEPVKKGE